MKIGRKIFSGAAVILAAVVVLALLSSCSPNPEEACLGKWSTENGSAKLELLKDGKIHVAERGTSTTTYLFAHGKYAFVDKDKIKVELDGYEHVGGPPVISVAISGDEMTWTYPNGDVLKYRKERG